MWKMLLAWAGPAILALIGWGIDLIPSNRSWIPSGVIWGLAFVWAVVAFIFWIIRRGKVGQIKEEHRDDNLINVLDKMHKRMIYFKSVRASKLKKLELGKLDVDGGILMDRLGLVPLDKWDSFKKGMKKRIKKAARRTRKGDWYFKVLCEASEIKRELCESKAWTIDDGLVVCEWLEERHWGIRELRDQDEVWKGLFESVKGYLVDTRLSELIYRHITYSYVGSSMMLVSAYSRKRPDGILAKALHSVLVGSPVDPVKIELAMGEVIGDIKRALEESEDHM
jgi:hypothetical protein